MIMTTKLFICDEIRRGVGETGEYSLDIRIRKPRKWAGALVAVAGYNVMVNFVHGYDKRVFKCAEHVYASADDRAVIGQICCRIADIKMVIRYGNRGLEKSVRGRTRRDQEYRDLVTRSLKYYGYRPCFDIELDSRGHRRGWGLSQIVAVSEPEHGRASMARDGEIML